MIFSISFSFHDNHVLPIMIIHRINDPFVSFLYLLILTSFLVFYWMTFHLFIMFFSNIVFHHCINALVILILPSDLLPVIPFVLFSMFMPAMSFWTVLPSFQTIPEAERCFSVPFVLLLVTWVPPLSIHFWTWNGFFPPFATLLMIKSDSSEMSPWSY